MSDPIRDDILETVIDQDICDVPELESGNLAGVIAWLQERLNEIPEEFRQSAEISFRPRGSYEQDVAHIRITYVRPETDAEYQACVEAAQQHKRHTAAKREKKERAEYERLKQKYGGA